MKWEKYAILALITSSLILWECWEVNFKLKFLDSTAVAQTTNNRKIEANRLFSLGNDSYGSGDYSKAIDYYRQSLKIHRQIENPSGIAYSLGGLGNAYHKLGDYPKAIDNHQQSLKIHKQIGKPSDIAYSLGNLGNVYRSSGDYPKAIDNHQQSLEIHKQINNSSGIAYSLKNLGLVYHSLGDYPKAIDSYQQSLKIHKQINNPSGIAPSLEGLGNAYHSSGDYPKAIDYHQQSLEIYKQIENPFGIASSLGGLGNAYYNLRDYPQAIDYHQQSLKIYKQIENPFGIAHSLGNLGIAYHDLEDYPTAIDYYQQSLEIHKQIGNRSGIAHSLNNLGVTYKKLKKYENAEKNLRQAITIWQEIRSSLGNKDSWKVSIFEEQAKTYRLLQEVLVAQKQPQQALIISEQGRTRALVEILYRTRHQKPQQELIPPPLTISQIQQVAKQQNATLVEYSIVYGNQLYIWVIPPKGKIQFRSVSLKGFSLQQLVKITREKQIHVRGRNSNNSPAKKDNSTNHLNQLHQLLITPIVDLLPQDEEQKVIFIPHQELFLVPFVALQDENNKYLIEKHTILTAPSIQALSLSQQNKPTVPTLPRGKDVLIVGNPTMPKIKVGKDKQPLYQLEGAQEEAEKIAKMLNAQAITGSQATESAIVEKMPSAKLIHFATHGLLDGINNIGTPGAIAFTPDGKQDGFLTTSEIMETFGLPGKPPSPLQADLVVLSACDTGKGDIRGEGVIGLSRAFMASGVPTLVVSLWKVPDEQTVTLMTEFYTNIYERKFNKAKAMRQAMLKMLNDEDGDPDPKNWAAFTVIGQP